MTHPQETQFSYAFTSAANGRQESRILFKRDGQTVKTLPQPKSAYGVRKVDPTPEELALIEAEDDRRLNIRDAATTAWVETGIVPDDLEAQIYSIS